MLKSWKLKKKSIKITFYLKLYIIMFISDFVWAHLPLFQIVFIRGETIIQKNLFNCHL